MKRRIKRLIGIGMVLLMFLEVFGWDTLDILAEDVSIMTDTTIETETSDNYNIQGSVFTVTETGNITGTIYASGGQIINNGTINIITGLNSTTMTNNGTVTSITLNNGAVTNSADKSITTITVKDGTVTNSGSIGSVIFESGGATPALVCNAGTITSVTNTSVSPSIEVSGTSIIKNISGTYNFSGSGTLSVTGSLNLSGDYSSITPTIQVSDVTSITLDSSSKLKVQYNEKDYTLTSAGTGTIFSLLGKKVTGVLNDSETMRAATGFSSDYYLAGDTATATYTAAEGYYFPAGYEAESNGAGSLTTNRVSATSVTVSYTFAETETNDTITITLPAATARETQDVPSGLVGGDKRVTGVTEDMEYAQSEDALVWTSCDTADGILTLTAGTWYFRYKETEEKLASSAVAVVVKQPYTLVVSDTASMTAETAFDTTLVYHSGDTATATYTTAEGYYFPTGYEAESNGAGSLTTNRVGASSVTVSYTFAETETNDTITITLPAATARETQDAPSGLVGGDKRVTGVTEDMEYAQSEDALVWTSCDTADGILTLAAGTWYFRYKETEEKLASSAVAVVVKQPYTLVVSDTASMTAETAFDITLVYHGGDTATATYTAAEGYYFPAGYEAESNGAGSLTTNRVSASSVTVSYTFAETETNDTITITLPAATARETQDAPSGLVGESGYVAGVTADMEYAQSEDALVWTSCEPVDGTQILDAGVWYFRYKETDVKYASPAVAIVVLELENVYIPAPEPAYEVSGSKGTNEYYTSNVKISAPEGYLLSESENGTYQKTLTITETTTITEIYLMRETDGAKTEAVPLESFLIDTTIPVINAQNNVLYYGNSAEVTVTDKNLSSVFVNGVPMQITASSYTVKLTSENGKKTYEIKAVDKAGNSKTVLVGIAAEWLKSGVVMEGTAVNLVVGSAYKLGAGTWKVSGDDTSYNGNQTFYVGSEGSYQFDAQ